MFASGRIWELAFPTRIHCGAGSRRRALTALQESSCHSPLLVCDHHMAGTAMVRDFLNLLTNAGFRPRLFSNFSAGPWQQQIHEGFDHYRLEGADSLIGMGGGASISMAKAIALKLTESRERPWPLILALPTTSGPGLEVSDTVLIGNEKSHQYKMIRSRALIPQQVFLDPELTLTLPAALTAQGGLQTLTNLLEGYLAPGLNPLCDGIALEGVRWVQQWFRTSVERAHTPAAELAENLRLRGGMMMAALMGGVSAQKGRGLTQACAQALATIKGLPHGLACGIMLDFVLEFNGPQSDDRYELLAEAAGLGRRPERLSEWVRDLKRTVGFPQSLQELGLRREDLEALVPSALATPELPLGTKPVRAETFRHLFERAMQG